MLNMQCCTQYCRWMHFHSTSVKSQRYRLERGELAASDSCKLIVRGDQGRFFSGQKVIRRGSMTVHQLLLAPWLLSDINIVAGELEYVKRYCILIWVSLSAHMLWRMGQLSLSSSNAVNAVRYSLSYVFPARSTQGKEIDLCINGSLITSAFADKSRRLKSLNYISSKEIYIFLFYDR